MAGFNDFSQALRAYLIDSSRSKPGSDVVVAGGQTTNYPATGNKRIRAGAAVVKESGDGLYYLASGADGASAGDINTVALVSSAEAPDGDWASKVVTWSVFYPDGSVVSDTVTLGAGDDTVAELVTALHANVNFRNHLLATANTILEIRSLVKDAVRVRISVNLTTAYGTVSGSSSYTDGTGTQADYRVITQDRDLIDVNGTSAPSHPVSTLMAGRFDESEMSHLSNEARAVLQGRGSTFE